MVDLAAAPVVRDSWRSCTVCSRSSSVPVPAAGTGAVLDGTVTFRVEATSLVLMNPGGTGLALRAVP